MANDNNRTPSGYAMYDAMTTPELEEILRADIESPKGGAADPEAIVYIAGLLAERKELQGKDRVEAAWETFQQEYLAEDAREEESPVPAKEGEQSPAKPRRTGRPALRRLLIAAAVLAALLGMGIVASALSGEDLWEKVPWWDGEEFRFTNKIGGDSAGYSQNDWAKETVPQDRFVSFAGELDSTDWRPDLLPAWIPEGYTLRRAKLDYTGDREAYLASYISGDKNIMVYAEEMVLGVEGWHEVEGDPLEIYEDSGVVYYFFRNVDRVKAIWIKDGYECYIAGDLTMEELKKMIDSVGKG